MLFHDFPWPCSVHFWSCRLMRLLSDQASNQGSYFYDQVIVTHGRAKPFTMITFLFLNNILFSPSQCVWFYHSSSFSFSMNLSLPQTNLCPNCVNIVSKLLGTLGFYPLHLFEELLTPLTCSSLRPAAPSSLARLPCGISLHAPPFPASYPLCPEFPAHPLSSPSVLEGHRLQSFFEQASVLSEIFDIFVPLKMFLYSTFTYGCYFYCIQNSKLQIISH